MMGKLSPKGWEYHENRTANHQKAKNNIYTGIKFCIESWCNKFWVAINGMKLWQLK